jgi:hypothetical protein
MDILVALRQEQHKLQQQLRGVESAINALSGSHSSFASSFAAGGRRRRTMSAAARAKISKAAKERWAKIRAGKK